ncbi:MAG TPA: DNA-binding protein WhiA [Atribacteraceae bacterium]|nr:DNA-binding protein WhiA [Atribacteraceae bacterium]
MIDFHERVKQELNALFPVEPLLVRAEWTGLLRGGGVYRQDSEGAAISFVHRELALIKKIIYFQKLLFPGFLHSLSRIDREGLSRGTYYQVIISHGPAHNLILDLNSNEDVIFNTGTHGFDHYIRGFFEARGYLGNPRRAYHLEFPISSGSLAERIMGRLSEESLAFTLRYRKGEYSLYTKKGSTIGDFLRFIGALRAYLEFEKITVEKSTINDIIRWANCETANLDKVVQSSSRQRRLIALLNTENLPPPLREIADLRVKYPFMSMRELGDRCNPILSKTEVFRRLRRIERQAIREGVDREEKLT